MRWKPHVRFGGRTRETYQPRGWHRALVRPHLGNRAVDDVRRRIQRDLTGHRGRRGDPLYDIRKILITGAERLGERGWARLLDALRRGDPHDDVLATWLAKEHLREVYAVEDPIEAARLLDAVMAECDDAGIAELTRLAGTLRRWREPILNHHRTGRSNGPTEAMIIWSDSHARHRRHRHQPKAHGRCRRGRVLWRA